MTYAYQYGDGGLDRVARNGPLLILSIFYPDFTPEFIYKFCMSGWELGQGSREWGHHWFDEYFTLILPPELIYNFCMSGLEWGQGSREWGHHWFYRLSASWRIFPHFVSDFYAFLFLLTVSQREIVSTCGLVLGDDHGMWVVLLKMQMK